MFPIHTNVPTRHPPIVVWLLIGFNTLVFFLELQLPEKNLERFTYLFGVVPARFTHPDWASAVGFPVGNYWPLLTSTFLHGGWFHLIGNMWTLWLFGNNVEDRMGPVRFLLFYLVCGALSGVVHLWVNADSTLPAIGASGAIAGVMGAYYFMFPRSRVIVMIPIFFFPFFFDFSAVLFLGFWFFLQLFSGTMAITSFNQGGGIAFWAHVGGFGAGVLLFRLFLRAQRERRNLFADEGTVVHAWDRRY